MRVSIVLKSDQRFESCLTGECERLFCLPIIPDPRWKGLAADCIYAVFLFPMLSFILPGIVNDAGPGNEPEELLLNMSY
jgi:hypothetical protein